MEEEVEEKTSGTFDGTIYRNDTGTHFDGIITYQFYDKFTDPYDLLNK